MKKQSLELLRQCIITINRILNIEEDVPEIGVTIGHFDTEDQPLIYGSPYDDEKIKWSSNMVNRGSIRINKNPEDITVKDVIDAYHVKPLYEDLKELNQYSIIDVVYDKNNSDFLNNLPKGIWTARTIGLETDTITMSYTVKRSTIAESNKKKIMAALACPNCIGFKLDQMYPLAQPSDVSWIELPRDFIIDGSRTVFNSEIGKDEIKAVGGFIYHGKLFVTTHSLQLSYLHVSKQNYTETGGGFYLNCVNGIESLTIENCIFDYYVPNEINPSTNELYKPEDIEGYCGGYVYIRSYNGGYICGTEYNVDEDGYLNDKTFIRHTYIYNNTFRGGQSVYSDTPFARNTFRFVNNTIYDMGLGMGLSLSSYNDVPHVNQNTASTCPIWIVGNTFIGQDKIFIRYATSNASVYRGGALVEASCTYMLHNTISNFITGKTFIQKIETSSNNLIGWMTNAPATYDSYINSSETYYCNNTVNNLTRLGLEVGSGIIKSKGAPGGWPSSEQGDRGRYWYYDRTKEDKTSSSTADNPTYYKYNYKEECDAKFCKAREAVKYFMNNTYNLDKQHIRQLYDNLQIKPSFQNGSYTYNTDPLTYYYNNVDFDDICRIEMQFDTHIPVNRYLKLYKFSGNTINAQGCYITGRCGSNPIFCREFDFSNNVFNARLITSVDQTDATSYKEYKTLVEGGGYQYGFCAERHDGALRSGLLSTFGGTFTRASLNRSWSLECLLSAWIIHDYAENEEQYLNKSMVDTSVLTIKNNTFNMSDNVVGRAIILHCASRFPETADPYGLRTNISGNRCINRGKVIYKLYDLTNRNFWKKNIYDISQANIIR